MPHDRGFTDLDESTAPELSRPALRATRDKLGFLPSAMARMSLAPLLPRAFQQALSTFDQTSLTPLEREVVVMTLARTVGCDVCVAMHRRILAALGHAELAPALERAGFIPDARLRALSAFTDAVLATHGDVDAEHWQAFLDAGFTRAQALEVVLGIGAYTLSTFANRLTQAPVDAQLRG
jgi:AhpD family alkylhydroperoxidase